MDTLIKIQFSFQPWKHLFFIIFMGNFEQSNMCTSSSSNSSHIPGQTHLQDFIFIVHTHTTHTHLHIIQPVESICVAELCMCLLITTGDWMDNLAGGLSLEKTDCSSLSCYCLFLSGSSSSKGGALRGSHLCFAVNWHRHWAGVI